MTEAKREYRKAVNFATVYADGAIVHFGLDTCRIIFYTEEIEIEEDGSGIANNKSVALLKYEVVLPRSILKHMATETYKLGQLEHYAIKIERSKHDTDERVTQAYWEFDKELGSIYFDTYKDLANQQIRGLADKFNDLTAIAGLRKEDLESEGNADENE
ncbi:hypothetical protein [Nitrososphaera viennensis]|uniref:Uncharacterized protein n=2 Tax=Nitrososphaera viennensis TaxID=1034015 RepID=A0A060HL17_9ARCH|nr:hypothetical protein [Nitrososphaera viennensis]AIC17214.1 hypothetical protein NVIE_029360 [Nitrososphaera viennensis EN76]UVS69101.1 hypothetical protein NWT39_14500 [Nitrososphaera viennensis]